MEESVLQTAMLAMVDNVVPTRKWSSLEVTSMTISAPILICGIALRTIEKSIMHLRCNAGGNTMKHMAHLAVAMHRMLAKISIQITIQINHP
jgi:hypothetical protein